MALPSSVVVRDFNIEGVDRPPNFESAIIALATFGLARLALTTWSLVTVRPSLWWLPIVAGAWETWIYTGQVSIAFGHFGDAFADNLDLLATALVTPGFRHFWLFPLAPVFIVPVLALRSLSLFRQFRPPRRLTSTLKYNMS